MPMHTYALLDFGDGYRVEQWGEYKLKRPDPTTIGMFPEHPELWNNVDAIYSGEKGKGEWMLKKDLPPEWVVTFGDVELNTRLAPYKHTGIFPEQEENWNWMRKIAQTHNRPLTILNLFAYTGGATIALAKDGHFVTHVDASKPSIGHAKENALLNNIASDGIRWILEDAPTFVQKEHKRGKKYDAILLDPPAYGHGGNGKTWRVERDLSPLLEQCCAILSDQPAFLLLNGYAQNDTPESFHRLLTGILHSKTTQKNFTIEAKELSLKAQDGRCLDTGIVARCRFQT